MARVIERKSLRRVISIIKNIRSTKTIKRRRSIESTTQEVEKVEETAGAKTDTLIDIEIEREEMKVTNKPTLPHLTIQNNLELLQVIGLILQTGTILLTILPLAGEVDSVLILLLTSSHLR